PGTADYSPSVVSQPVHAPVTGSVRPRPDRIQIRTIRTERLFGQKRTGRREGTRAAAAADRAIAAHPAFALERRRIAQLLEHRRVSPDVGKPLHARVAGRDRQIPAGIHTPLVRDEADARPRQAARVMADRCWPWCPPPRTAGAAFALVPGAMKVLVRSPRLRSS